MGEFLPSPSGQLGTLRMGETLWYYDGPVLFTVLDNLDRIFLAIAIPDVEDAARFLYVPISPARLKRVRSGRVSLRDAFRDAESGNGFVVSVPYVAGHETTVEFVQLSGLGDEYFSEPDVFLSPEGVETPQFTRDEFTVMARLEQRELVALELSGSTHPSLARGRLPLSIGGPILTELNDYAATLGAESEYDLVQLQAASTVIVLAPVVREGQIFAYSGPVTGRIVDSLSNAGTSGFSDFVTKLPRRERLHLRDFLAAVSNAGADLNIFSANIEGMVSEVVLPRGRIATALQTLRENVPGETKHLKLTGALIGINHVHRTFSFRELTPSKGRKKTVTYSGHIGPEVDVEGVESGATVIYEAQILQEETVSAFAIDETAIKKNTLLRLESVTPGGQAES